MGVISPQTKFTKEHIVTGTATLVSGVIAVTIPSMSVITGGFASLSAAAPPGTATSALSCSFSANVLTIEGYMPTATADTALVDSTGTETVNYLVTGY